ncbi:Zinc/iron permease [Coemansia reversa NRRL 1564]|uniref:Zinc/iron permease n=1 Tax=Coemansia reversa (strain ATCC 12441 / NRRL 1564) TaxID=763665 RepID=A0A2G5B7S2_COERN|nr:Zinc/iron permease [Coemansia reversa NRRL 1564]|eukprot:PIA15059.1 Zinc/iron permease [Coemansia reversa NRRL 1564]
MQAVFRLILEGLAMFAGSWVAGCVPLYVRMDQRKFSILALFGAGLLIGAALAVILPEGVETLSKSMLTKQQKKDTDELVESMNSTIGWSLVAGFCTMLLIDNIFPSAHPDHDRQRTDAPERGIQQQVNNDPACLEEIQMSPQGQHIDGRTESESTLHTSHDHFTQQQLDRQYQQNQQRQHSADDSLSSFPMTMVNTHEPEVPENGIWDFQAHKQQPRWRRILVQLCMALSPHRLPSTLIGILVHSCADGLALGAAVAASAAQTDADSNEHSSSLEIIVFLALLLHKAPAAFGLITTLKQQGFAKYKLGIWLTVFAASAPLAALVTFAVFLLVNPSSDQQELRRGTDEPIVQPWTGIVMLYSAGTFLYVAMAHTLTEAVHHAKTLRAHAKQNQNNSRSDNISANTSLGLLNIAVLLLGVILPPLVSKDHDE